jgi:hypothetical protein
LYQILSCVPQTLGEVIDPQWILGGVEVKAGAVAVCVCSGGGSSARRPVVVTGHNHRTSPMTAVDHFDFYHWTPTSTSTLPTPPLALSCSASPLHCSALFSHLTTLTMAAGPAKAEIAQIFASLKNQKGNKVSRSPTNRRANTCCTKRESVSYLTASATFWDR